MEEKITQIRENIVFLKKNKKIASLLTLFREKEEIQNLTDFEIDNPKYIWYYFYHVSLELGFPPGIINMLLNDVREIVIQIMDNPPNNIYNIIMRAGKYNPELIGYEGGYPEREQHVWHMLLWFFAESESDIIDAIVDRFIDLCNKTKLLGYHERMVKRINRHGFNSIKEWKEQLPLIIEEVFTKNGKKNIFFIKECLKKIADEKMLKSDYLFVELALYNLGYIKEMRRHMSFIKVLETWKITKPGFIKETNLAEKLSTTLNGDITGKTWKKKYIYRFDYFKDKFKRFNH